MRSRKLFLLFLFVICHLTFVIYSSALAQEYDGIWFLGFNFNKAACADINFRRAAAASISIDKIATDIMSAEVAPGSIVPPGMAGYLPNVKCQISNVKLGTTPKKVVLLHTDGVKTIEIAKQIKEDLKKIGIVLTLKQVDYAKEGAWEKALAKGDYHLFLMGYKAEGEDLLGPLFSSKGEANFCNYKSARLDALIKQKKYKEANKILFDNTAAVVLMYIPKL